MWVVLLSRQISIITIANQRLDRRRQMRSEYKLAVTSSEHRRPAIDGLRSSSSNVQLMAWLKFNDTRRPAFGITASERFSASNAANDRTRRLDWIGLQEQNRKWNYR